MSVQLIRKVHLWLGVFFAPSLVFFCLTGGLMTFRLQERLPGGGDPPAWLSLAGRIHMSESLTPKPPKAAPSAMPSPTAQPSAGAGENPPVVRRPPSVAMKVFALFMALGIVTTTILGVVMAFRFHRDKRLLWGLLVLGTALPAILVVL